MNVCNIANVLTQMRECRKPDQLMANSCDALISVDKSKDWATIEATIKESVPEVEIDTTVCVGKKRPGYKTFVDQ